MRLAYDLVDYDSGEGHGHVDTSPWLHDIRKLKEEMGRRKPRKKDVPDLDDIREMLDAYNRMYGTSYEIVKVTCKKYEPIWEEVA